VLVALRKAALSVQVARLVVIATCFVVADHDSPQTILAPASGTVTITVEFFGVARLRSRAASVKIPADHPLTLAEVLAEIARRLPGWGEAAAGDTGRLPGEIIANIDGRQFTRDLSARVEPGQTLLLLSADAGG